METDKHKLLEFIKNLTPEEAEKLSANLSALALELQAPARPFPLEYSQQR